ncbi:GNAT family N-acetyltransferase [Lentisphaera profundi]|uniref:GNAT family N-acetyltransferase n=1 Tax=Lentisphaera profundi TaxID=1658616 RepID=A0ABY7VYW9_9BACT|nr:GNAT family N-acetyltransferase [Lentisphaera profundi]WDE99302.1 GNAT family N-acetyltransferase [Lentisphaera profundi]
MKIEIKKICYKNQQQAQDLIFLLNHYAMDPMGGGKELNPYVTENLVAKLAKLAHASTYIAYANEKPAGLLNCFESLSTFSAKPLINIHDLMVHSDYRGLGISQEMLKRLVDDAEEQGCCKITLEVLEGNKVALNAYKKFGFENYQLDPEVGQAIFMEKKL